MHPMQFRHYKAALAVFSLKPSEEYQDFAELAAFIAQVNLSWPKLLPSRSDYRVSETPRTSDVDLKRR